MVFHNDRLQKASFHEVTKLGATTRLDCMVGNEKYTSLGTYWPVVNKVGHSYWNMLKQQYNQMDPIGVIKAGLVMATRQASERGAMVLVAGDMNTSLIRRDKQGLGALMASVGMTDASVGPEKLRYSFRTRGADQL